MKAWDILLSYEKLDVHLRNTFKRQQRLVENFQIDSTSSSPVLAASLGNWDFKSAYVRYMGELSQERDF